MSDYETPKDMEIETLTDDDLDSASGGMGVDVETATNSGTGICTDGPVNTGTGTCS